MKQLKSALEELKKIGVVGVKQSTEDEGAAHKDIALIRDISRSCGLKLNIKIGGCEAKTDISFCDSIKVDGIVAPMIESEFALKKFTESISHIKDVNFYINIESSTAVDNIDNILESNHFNILNGIVLGRSDLTNSYGYEKESVDSIEMQNKVYDILKAFSKKSPTIIMGGNINKHSIPFIKKLYYENILDFIETRNVIIDLEKAFNNDLEKVIEKALIFEALWLEFKANKYLTQGKEYMDRAKQIKGRI